MCDLIRRQDAIDAFYKHPNIDWTTLDVLAKINALPSAQPDLEEAYICGETEAEARFHADIVRCKDCKHSRFFDPCFYCYEFGEEINVPENGFCFMAERRTDGV